VRSRAATALHCGWAALRLGCTALGCTALGCSLCQDQAPVSGHVALADQVTAGLIGWPGAGPRQPGDPQRPRG